MPHCPHLYDRLRTVYFLLICPWSLNYAVTIQQISTCYHCLILPMQSERVQGRHRSTADRCYLSSYAGSFYCLLSLSISQSIERQRERVLKSTPPPPPPALPPLSKPESRSRPHCAIFVKYVILISGLAPGCGLIRGLTFGSPVCVLHLCATLPLLLPLCCLMSSDVGWHIRDKLRPMHEHGSILLYDHGLYLFYF